MTNLFQNIEGKNKEKLLKLIGANYYFFPKNANILFLINDENNIGFIESGAIQVVRNDYNGNRIILEDLLEGDIFGSNILLISSEESDIITKEDTKIIIIDYEKVLNLENVNYTYYSQFIKNLIRTIIEKINEKNIRIEILSKKTIRNRLLEYFRIMSQKNSSKIIYLPYTYTELADFLAVDRSAMSREIKSLKNEGFIKTTKGKITLLY